MSNRNRVASEKDKNVMFGTWNMDHHRIWNNHILSCWWSVLVYNGWLLFWIFYWWSLCRKNKRMRRKGFPFFSFKYQGKIVRNKKRHRLNNYEVRGGGQSYKNIGLLFREIKKFIVLLLLLPTITLHLSKKQVQLDFTWRKYYLVCEEKVVIKFCCVGALHLRLNTTNVWQSKPLPLWGIEIENNFKLQAFQ